MIQPFVSIEEIKESIDKIKSQSFLKHAWGVAGEISDRLLATAETMELADVSQWKSAPVTALLSNALRMLNNEQMKSLTQSLAERCGLELKPKKPVTAVPAKEFTDLRDYILHKEKEGIVVFNTIEGLYEMKLEDIINQPTDGLLYDLNRDRATVLTWIEDQKWVNDFAVYQVIKKLKDVPPN